MNPTKEQLIAAEKVIAQHWTNLAEEGNMFKLTSSLMSVGMMPIVDCFNADGTEKE